MFIKRLIISGNSGIIRDISFKEGLNLIIDETPMNDIKLTGNNVGKTTVLKLIDFCLGAKPQIIYTDTENKNQVYQQVKDFLIEERVEVTLILTDNLKRVDDREVEIKRNFIPGKKAMRRVNGKNVLEKEFEHELEKAIMPYKTVEKPSFRQVISHNIRYTDETINNTLKTLNKFTKDIEYETLYLYLLGCTFDDGAKKHALISQLNQEKVLKERLERKYSKHSYEIMLMLLDGEIDDLNQKRSSLNLNENLEKDLEQLNLVKYNINKTSSHISRLKIRKNLIEESIKELKDSAFNIDLQQLRILYNEVTKNIDGIQKTFEDLVSYHNSMVNEKIKYISKELPQLNQNLNKAYDELKILLTEEKELTDEVGKSDSLEELEKIVVQLNEKHRRKGEVESILSQLNEIECNMRDLEEKIKEIDNHLFSEEFNNTLKKQVEKLSKIFSSISQELYGEQYALTYKEDSKNGQKIYKFSAFNTNMSSGKKQGEILCFDLAYTLFADEEHIQCLHFLLNDKKELMHDNQLIKVAEFIQNKNIQLIVSILKDKLPEAVLEKAHVVVKLSPKDKLFRIEDGHY